MLDTAAGPCSGVGKNNRFCTAASETPPSLPFPKTCLWELGRRDGAEGGGTGWCVSVVVVLTRLDHVRVSPATYTTAPDLGAMSVWT